MNRPDLIWSASSAIEDEIFEMDEIYQSRPFVPDFDRDSSDSEQIESLVSENPFCESAYIFQKHKSIEFKSSKKASRMTQTSYNWAKSSYVKSRDNSLIRSAPTCLKGTHWETNNNGEITTLPVLGCGRSDSIKRISPNTLNVILSGVLKRNFIVVDARFSYEYQGGHIKNALNHRSEIELMDSLKKAPQKPEIVIFYCEFSSERAPLLAKNFRNADRNQNKYPDLLFPEMYILDGGYKAFFTLYASLCVPISYIQMNDRRFKKECIQQHKKIKIKKV